MCLNFKYLVCIIRLCKVVVVTCEILKVNEVFSLYFLIMKYNNNKFSSNKPTSKFTTKVSLLLHSMWRIDFSKESKKSFD